MVNYFIQHKKYYPVTLNNVFDEKTNFVDIKSEFNVTNKHHFKEKKASLLVECSRVVLKRNRGKLSTLVLILVITRAWSMLNRL